MYDKPEEKKEKMLKRKKSVHFPENYVVPIDDSSFENSEGDRDQDR